MERVGGRVELGGGGAHRRLTGLGIASGSILCLDFCTAGSSDACFTFTRLSGTIGQKRKSGKRERGV